MVKERIFAGNKSLQLRQGNAIKLLLEKAEMLNTGIGE